MSKFQNHLERLAAAGRWTYGASAESSAEPAAWSTLALLAHGMVDASRAPANWLVEQQQPSGAIGVSAAQDDPRWPTSLAMLAWCAVDRAAGTNVFQEHIELAAHWSLAARGDTCPRSPMIGHDTTLIGWSWADNTASWLEPTCLFILGLRAAGYGDHARARQGLRLVVDRLLPDGGANYGNTVVLGQTLLPHMQPSGLAMLALAGQPANDGRIEKTLQYLEHTLGLATTPASLSFAILGLAAWGRRPAEADEWLQAAPENDYGRPLAEYERALLLLAADTRLNWLHGDRESIPIASAWREPNGKKTAAGMEGVAS